MNPLSMILFYLLFTFATTWNLIPFTLDIDFVEYEKVRKTRRNSFIMVNIKLIKNIT